MSYFFSKILAVPFDEAVERAKAALAAEGFGVLTDIDLREAFRKKLGATFRRYRILGACHPQSALNAVTRESHIGLMLPCNVVVQEADGGVEVSAIDPVASMAAVDNPALAEVAGPMREMLRRVIDSL